MRAFVEQRLHHLLDEERIAAGTLGDKPHERIEFDALAEQRRQHRRAIRTGQRIQPELRIVALVRPLVPVLGTIVHQQQHASVGDAIGQEIEQRLGLRVDPVQVFENHDYRLFQAFAKNDAFDRIERPLTLDLRIHLGNRIGTLDDAEQSEQVRQRIIKCGFEPPKCGTNLLTARCRIIDAPNAEIVAQQFEHRQPRRRLAVRHRVGFEQFTFRRQLRLELVEQARFAGAGLRYHRHDLPVSDHRQFKGALHLLKLVRASDELGQPAPCGEIEVAARRPGCDDLVNVDRFGDSFNFGRSQAAELKITFDEAPRIFTDDDPIGRRRALHARGQIDHVTHG